MHRTLWLVILLSVILLGLASCTTTGVSPDSSGTCDNALYPVVQGATWTYVSAGGPSGSFIYTDTISNVRADGFTLDSRIGEVKRVQEWYCASDGLQALQIGGGSAAGISTQGITAEFITSNINGSTLPRDITSGLQWQYSLTMQGTMAMPGDQQSPASGTYTVTMKELGKETVKVPAGEFEAIKFQADSKVDILTDFQGIQVPVVYNGLSLIWYAPNVGFIKSVENGDFSGTMFSITTELQSYSIP